MLNKNIYIYIRFLFVSLSVCVCLHWLGWLLIFNWIKYLTMLCDKIHTTRTLIPKAIKFHINLRYALKMNFTLFFRCCCISSHEIIKNLLIFLCLFSEFNFSDVLCALPDADSSLYNVKYSYFLRVIICCFPLLCITRYSHWIIFLIHYWLGHLFLLKSSKFFLQKSSIFHNIPEHLVFRTIVPTSFLKYYINYRHQCV